MLILSRPAPTRRFRVTGAIIDERLPALLQASGVKSRDARVARERRAGETYSGTGDVDPPGTGGFQVC
jgi:hypothetical protein